MSLDRDLELAGVADDVLDRTLGLANATLACVKFPDNAQARSLKLTAEIVRRFEALTVTLLPYALEYRDDMTEVQLRAWAAGVAAVLK